MSQKKSESYVPPPSRSNGIEASDNGLAAENSTTRERIRRPGPWTAIPSHIARDRSYMKLSLSARHMHLMAFLYCNHERTDGRLGSADFRKVAAESQLSESEAESAAQELVTAGLWRPGYELVGYLEWNLSAAEIEERAAAARTRMQKGRDSKKGSPKNPSQETETQITQITQERSGERSIERDVAEATKTSVLVTAWCQQTGKPASSRDLAELKSWEEEFGFRVPVSDMVTTLGDVWARAIASGVTPEHPGYFRRAIRELSERTSHNRSANGATTTPLAMPYVVPRGIGEPCESCGKVDCRTCEAVTA